MPFRVFWAVAPCGQVDVDDVSDVRTASIIRAMEAVRSSETSVHIDYTALHPRRLNFILAAVRT
jgi:hypothetical protein